MLNQKSNLNRSSMTLILVATFAILGFLLLGAVSNLISLTATQETKIVEVAPAHAIEPFDYTRDQQQYETSYVWTAYEPFNYTRDQQQYEVTYAQAYEPFDYTRDRDQYWQNNNQ